ncbi:MAG: ABC transporter permease, partial [Bacteroidota bacterium]
MLASFLKISLRFLWRKRLFSGFNFLGLWVSYTALILIGIYLFRETHYESFHQKSERIFRVAHHTTGENGFETHWARTYLDFVNQMPEEVPGISHLIRFQNHQRRFLKIGEQSYRPPHTYSTDAEVFEVFDFPLLRGDPHTALREPHSIVLSASLAKQYFGDLDPMGQAVEIMGEYNLEAEVHTVTGVMEDLPAHTHLPVDALLSFQDPEERAWWAYVYILLEPGIKGEQVQSQLASFVASHQEETTNNQTHLELQALPDIHLDSHLAREIVPNGNRLYVHILMGVALFIWLIALINYLNLSSALSLQRQKEVGLHRVLGAQKGQLMRFAWLESMGFHAMAGLLSLGTAFFLMPWWKSTTGIEWETGWGSLGLPTLGIACLIGGLAGIYPASVLVRASTQQVFRAASKQSR